VSANNVLRYFFWLAFAVFLLASISHVAYFFRAFEPQDTSLYWWLVAYAIAISVDVTIFLLSMTVAELRRRKVSNWLVSSVWVFIAGLALLSWYINWQYAVEFASHMLDRPASYWLVGMINPIIASCFQALAIAYTWISDKIAQSDEQYAPAQVRNVQSVHIEEEQPAMPLLVGEHQGEQGANKSEQIRALLAENASLTDRELAELVRCSVSTANKWKRRIGQESEAH
jgi:hypothetical protein